MTHQQVSGSCHFEGLWLRQNVGSHVPSCAVSCHWRMYFLTTQLWQYQNLQNYRLQFVNRFVKHEINTSCHIENLCNTTFVALVNKVPLSSIWHWSECFLCFICGQYQVLVYKSFLLFISLQNWKFHGTSWKKNHIWNSLVKHSISFQSFLE